jgi:hypothetical protein
LFKKVYILVELHKIQYISTLLFDNVTLPIDDLLYPIEHGDDQVLEEIAFFPPPPVTPS